MKTCTSQHVHFMTDLIRINSKVSKAILKASQVLIDYEYWLKRNYGVKGAYYGSAKTFLKGYVQGGDILSQLEDYLNQKAPSYKSMLNRFFYFLEHKQISFVINDLNETKLPISNLYVKLYLVSVQDRLKSKGSLSIYATILNSYFTSIKDDVTRINKRTAGKFILSPNLSDYTKRLYKAVLKSFCEWVLSYQSINNDELSKDQKRLKRGLKKISTQSLREIITIRVSIPRSVTSTYHKESLSEKQRKRLLDVIKNPRDRAIITLMGWNGLRSVEVTRLSYSDIKLNQGKLAVWGKGRSEKSKDVIKLSGAAKKELIQYLKKSKVKRGVLFPDLTRVILDDLISKYFKRIRVKGKYTPHSLRHTAGQIMYDNKIPLEIIQKTLRHADMRTTMIYAQKAIDRNYFKRLRRF